MKNIGENTKISLAVAIALMSASTFLAHIYFLSQRSDREIEIIRSHLTDMANENRLDRIHLEGRLKAIEIKLDDAQQWCRQQQTWPKTKK